WRTTEAGRAGRRGRTVAESVHPLPTGQTPHARGEHDHEAADAERDEIDHHADHQQDDTDDEADGGLHHAALVMVARVTDPDGVGPLRVLGVEGLLDLVEQALLVLRERHGASQGRPQDGEYGNGRHGVSEPRGRLSPEYEAVDVGESKRPRQTKPEVTS